MKKVWVAPILLCGFLLTGCSVDLDHFSSKTEEIESRAEKFATKAEAMGNEFEDALDILKHLERKDQLTSEDQEIIVTEIDSLSAVIDEFVHEEAPLFQGPKEFAVDKLKEREEILLDIQEKAKNGEATMEDVNEMKNALSDNFQINLFRK